MEITGKIIQILPIQTGISQRTGNPWAIQTYILETQEQFQHKVCFEIFGEQRIKENPCNINDLVTVSFDIDSREFNGKWYTSVRAWKIQQGGGAANPEQQGTVANPTTNNTTPQAATAPVANTTFDANAQNLTEYETLPF